MAGQNPSRSAPDFGSRHSGSAAAFAYSCTNAPRTPDRTRIIALGDSLTYGKAIAAFWAYPAQLGRGLKRNFDVEVLNLGAPGTSSEQILENLRTFLPQLDPDLVFYGVCLNDFEPAGYTHERRWVVPIPHGVEKFIIRRTRLGRFLNHRYDQLMRDLGVRPDFDSNILVDFDSRTARFGSDVEKMNAIVVEAALPPVVAMVLNTDTSGSSRNKRMVDAAEESLREAGMDVIPSAPFSRAFSGRDFSVSRWDGHPNEEANAIWAKMLWQYFVGRPEFKRHRSARSPSAEP